MINSVIIPIFAETGEFGFGWTTKMAKRNATIIAFIYGEVIKFEKVNNKFGACYCLHYVNQFS